MSMLLIRSVHTLIQHQNCLVLRAWSTSPPRRLDGWVKEFSWPSPRSSSLPVRAFVKEVKVRPWLFFATGVTFKQWLYHQPPPGLHHSHVTAMSVLMLVPLPSWRGLRPGFLAELGPISSWWLCWVITRLCLTLATVSGPDPNQELPLHNLAPYAEVTAPACRVTTLHSQLAFPWEVASRRCSMTLLCFIWRTAGWGIS